MKHTLSWSICVLLLVAPVQAQQPQPQPPPGKLIKEFWDAAYLEGAKCGFFHTTVREVERGGQKIYVTTLGMSLLIKRYKEVINQRMQIGTEETADGKVVGIFMVLFVDKDRTFTQRGRVAGDKLLLTINNDPNERTVPWNNEVVGLYKQTQLFKEKKVKPGDKLEVLNFEPPIQRAVKVSMTIKEPQEVDLLVEKNADNKLTVERVRQKLLPVEAVSEKIEIGGQPIPLPKLIWWLDKDMEIVRAQMDQPGLGVMTMYRTTETIARKEGYAPELLPDIGLKNIIALNKAIPNIGQTNSVVYQMTIKDDEDPTTIFAQDDRQKVLQRKGKTFELQVQAQKVQPTEQPGEPKPEFLKSSYFLNSDNAAVKALAGKIVGEEENAYNKAAKIEKWVHDKMTPDASIGFVPASQIAHDLKGDCRQHAMLTAALCRAVGVPSRTALGLVYADLAKEGPSLVFHMWTEVWIKGQWLSLDAVLGQGGVTVGHLKITDHSWTDIQTLAPVLPVIRAMGKIKVEVVKVQ